MSLGKFTELDNPYGEEHIIPNITGEPTLCLGNPSFSEGDVYEDVKNNLRLQMQNGNVCDENEFDCELIIEIDQLQDSIIQLKQHISYLEKQLRDRKV
jgi:hypothetical protein